MVEYQHDSRLLLVLKKRSCWQELLLKNTERVISGFSNRAIFSVIKKEYAIMFGLFLAF